MSTQPHRQIGIAESALVELQEALEAGRKYSGALAQQQPQPDPTGCSLKAVWGPDGTFLGSSCVGKCPWYKRIFGGTCHKASPGTPGGGVEVFCWCDWGILQPIVGFFGRSTTSR